MSYNHQRTEGRGGPFPREGVRVCGGMVVGVFLCIIFEIKWKSSAIPLNDCTHTHDAPWQASEHEADMPLKERLNQCPPVLPATKTALKAEPMS